MVDSPSDEVLFEVVTPLGFKVRVSRAYWKTIITMKHPVMAEHESFVRETLANPEEVRISRGDESVYLFYSKQGQHRWVCAVTKRLESEGFLITAYPTDAIKEGVLIWPV
jgi:hypothetical protein